MIAEVGWCGCCIRLPEVILAQNMTCHSIRDGGLADVFTLWMFSSDNIWGLQTVHAAFGFRCHCQNVK